MAELTEAMDAATAMLEEVTRDPQSPGASRAVRQMADDIHRLLDSPQFVALTRLPLQER
jgi:hypothetical protein